VHQINEIVHDAVGDDAEIIFGAVHEPAMQGEIRVTVIATGFDRQLQIGGMGASSPGAETSSRGNPSVLPFPRGDRPAAPGGRVLNASPRVAPATEAPRPRSPVPNTERPTSDLSDMEIPTFIRRQMD
jgi:cell division protein FtsZ